MKYTKGPVVWNSKIPTWSQGLLYCTANLQKDGRTMIAAIHLYCDCSALEGRDIHTVGGSVLDVARACDLCLKRAERDSTV